MSGFEGLRDEFVMEANERLSVVEEMLLRLLSAPSSERAALANDVKRELHTLKGNSAMMGLKELQALAHGLEDQIATIDLDDPDVGVCLRGLDHFRDRMAGVVVSSAGQQGPDASTASLREDHTLSSIRVSFASLDALVDLLAEMVIFRNRVGDAVSRGRRADRSNPAWDDVSDAHDSLGKTLGSIQEGVMRLRMVPLGTLFGSLERIVYDEASRLGKRIKLVASGGDTPMDKALREVASEALGHIVRNAAVHGIEAREHRARAGKAETGTILLSAATHGNEVWIDVTDDGNGIDPQELFAAAAERGVELPAGADPLSLLFRPGFSTRTGADVGSGRGVGLSAAAAAVHSLAGRIEVTSEVERGTRFRVKLPLSVSITRAMILRADGEEYALPLASIIESVRLRPGEGHQINHAGVFRWRGRAVPVVDLGHVTGTSVGMRESGFVILIGADGKVRGLIADALAGIREIVVKGLDPVVGTPEGVSGSTILGDGRVLLILDPRGLVAAEPFLRAQRGTPPEGTVQS